MHHNPQMFTNRVSAENSKGVKEISKNINESFSTPIKILHTKVNKNLDTPGKCVIR